MDAGAGRKVRAVAARPVDAQAQRPFLALQLEVEARRLALKQSRLDIGGLADPRGIPTDVLGAQEDAGALGPAATSNSIAPEPGAPGPARAVRAGCDRR